MAGTTISTMRRINVHQSDQSVEEVELDPAVVRLGR